MPNLEFACIPDRGSAPWEKNPTASAFDGTALVDFNRLSGEEIERLIALGTSPTVPWSRDTSPSRPPEPFGMIA